MIKNELIPIQTIGNKLDIIESKEFDTVELAISTFETVRSQLFDIDKWHQVCKSGSSKFKLIKIAENVSRDHETTEPEVGDYISIKIPGPATRSGKGFDWVIVEALTEGSNDAGEIIAMTVRPATHFQSEVKNIAHFFTEDATSTFIITRQNNFITAEVHGRNEIANVHTSIFSDNFRNRLVSLGAKMGFSYPQWKLLAKGLVSH